VSRSRHRRQSRGRWLVAVAAALAVLVLVVAMAWADRTPGRDGADAGGADGAGSAATTGEDTGAAQPTGSPTPANESASRSGTGSAGPDGTQLWLQTGTSAAQRLDAVPLSGSYRPGATLHVQLEAGGSWSSFPLGVVVGEDGRFATYVELGGTGPNRLRMVEPATGTTSNEVVVTVG
jgi:hypothetical protein